MKVKLTNDKLRRAFLDNYEAWGVWFYEPRLGVNYYRCSFPYNSGIIVEEQTSAGLHSPRVVTSIKYHRVSAQGRYDMAKSSMADMIRMLRRWTGTVEIGTSDMTS